MLFSEMAYNNGIIQDNGLNRESEWIEALQKAKTFIKVISDKISAKHYKIYKYGASFYLTTEDDSYLGHLEIDNNNNISNSYSKISGFYNIMFTNILAHTDIKEIASDISLSPSALKSYNKLSILDGVKFKVLIGIKDGKKIVHSEPFDNEKLLNGRTRVIITEHSFNFTKQLFEDFNKKISFVCDGIPGFYNSSYINKKDIIDLWLYNEIIG